MTDPTPAWLDNANVIADDGERVSHLSRDCVYYAHLSIYRYALPWSRGARVLDAGSGAGYGAAYLADAGAQSVLGVDASAKAVAFSQHHFERPNLSFQTARLDQLPDFPPGSFDLIYSSNTLEHVPDVPAFLRAAARLLTPAGTLLVAVPPITDDRLRYLNLINPYHLNLWSPRQWAHTLGLYFEELTPVRHGVQRLGADFQPEHFTPASTLTEADFVFAPGPVEAMYQGFTLTAIFQARRPRPAEQRPAPETPLTFVDDSFTRAPGEIPPPERERLQRFFEMPAPPVIRPARWIPGVNLAKGLWRRARAAFRPRDAR